MDEFLNADYKCIICVKNFFNVDLIKHKFLTFKDSFNPLILFENIVMDEPAESHRNDTYSFLRYLMGGVGI